MAALGRTLTAAGDEVIAFQLPELKRTIEAEGLEFRSILAGDEDRMGLAAAIARLGTMNGFAAIRFTIRCGSQLADLVCRAGPAALAAARLDLALVDQNEPAGATVAEKLGIPFISVSSALPLNREPAVPPPFAGWQYRETAAAIVRNRLAYAAFDRFLAPTTNTINRYRRQWRLTPILRPDDTFSRLAQVSQLTHELDFPRRFLPACFHYTGPFSDDARRSASFPWEELRGGPIVYASLGTLQTGRQRYFEIIAEACAGLDLQLIISTGRGSRMEPGRLRGGPIVVEYAPQLKILERASLCITHAGLNTVLESLAAGVPMVAIPITNDQPAVAARLQRTGAGEVVPLSRLSVPKLRLAVETVLAKPCYRRRAVEQQQCIRNAGGVARAAAIVQEAVRRFRPAISRARSAN